MTDPKDVSTGDWLDPISTYSEGIVGNSHVMIISNRRGTITRKATRHPDGSIERTTIYSNQDVYDDEISNSFTGLRGGIKTP